MSRLCIKWTKSCIGYSKDQKRTLKALGFHKLCSTVEQEDSPSLRGMIDKVQHLVSVEVIDSETK